MYIPADKTTWNKIFRDQLPRQPKFWLPIFLIMLLVFLLPEKLPVFGPVGISFVDRAASLVPSIETWIAHSNKPYKTGILFTFLWLALPYYVMVMASHQPYEKRFVNKWLQAGYRRHLYPFLIVPFAAGSLLVLYFFALPEEPACKRFCVHESLIIQLFLGFAGLIGLAGLFAGLTWWIRNFGLLHLSFKNDRVKK